jgi:hypothetical protein
MRIQSAGPIRRLMGECRAKVHTHKRLSVTLLHYSVGQKAKRVARIEDQQPHRDAVVLAYANKGLKLSSGRQ